MSPARGAIETVEVPMARSGHRPESDITPHMLVLSKATLSAGPTTLFSPLARRETDSTRQ